MRPRRRARRRSGSASAPPRRTRPTTAGSPPPSPGSGSRSGRARCATATPGPAGATCSTRTCGTSWSALRQAQGTSRLSEPPRLAGGGRHDRPVPGRARRPGAAAGRHGDPLRPLGPPVLVFPSEARPGLGLREQRHGRRPPAAAGRRAGQALLRRLLRRGQLVRHLDQPARSVPGATARTRPGSPTPWCRSSARTRPARPTPSSRAARSAPTTRCSSG